MASRLHSSSGEKPDMRLLPTLCTYIYGVGNKQGNPSRVTMRSEYGVVSEGRFVSEQDFHSLGRCTMAHGTNKCGLWMDAHCSFITWTLCLSSPTAPQVERETWMHANISACPSINKSGCKSGWQLCGHWSVYNGFKKLHTLIFSRCKYLHVQIHCSLATVKSCVTIGPILMLSHISLSERLKH